MGIGVLILVVAYSGKQRCRHDRKGSMRNNKVIIIIIILIIIICGLIKGKISSFFMKEIISDKITENENSLSMLLDNLENDEKAVHMVIQQSDAEDTIYLRDLFINFNLQEIFISVNKDIILDDKGTYVFFPINKNKLSMSLDVEYGFYYTELNKPIRYYGLLPYKDGEKSTYFGMCYQYHTEKIKDNWWYYEIKFY